MKKLFGFLFILVAGVAWAAPNPADYPVKIHVVSTHLLTLAETSGLHAIQVMSVVIDGKTYELSGNAASVSYHEDGLISPGDYPARVTLNNHRESYLRDTQYELLFPDGKTMKLTITGETE